MDDTLAEIFLEEIPPTGKQLICRYFENSRAGVWMDGLSCIFDRFPLSLCYAELYTHFEWFMPMIYRRTDT